MNALLGGLLAGCCAVLASIPLRADDIDIYVDRGADCATRAIGTLVAPSLSTRLHKPTDAADDIYFPMFESAAGPRWPGNVKKLKIVELAETDPTSGDVTVREVIAQAPLTSPPKAAMSSEDGGILADALTYWTDPAGADVVAFDAALGEVSGRDGRSVTRGGAGQQLPGLLAGTATTRNSEPAARQLFTLDPDRPGEWLALDASVDLPVLSPYLDQADRMTPEEERALLAWIRGQDAFDEDADADVLEARDWLLGDVIHSRPLVVNYGARAGTAYTRDNPDIRLFFGTNHGMFHVIENTFASGARRESGRESWAFVPLELLAMQAELAKNQAGAFSGHRYGMDGEAVALVEDNNADGALDAGQGDSVWVFIGQRRGGRGLYAFDMSDPERPRFKWRINHQTPGFEQLALTFSTPRVARLDLGAATLTPVLLFAGGYNGGWVDSLRVGKDAGNANDTTGNAIYVVNADSGELIWKAVGPDGGAVPQDTDRLHYAATMTHSIASPLSVVDSDNDGRIDRAYVGDTGGNVWRIGLPSDTADWQVTRLADLGGTGVEDRRFFHAPDVVRARDGNGHYDGIVIVSGNRAAPKQTSVRDYAYLIKDRNSASSGESTAPPPAMTMSDLADITHSCAGGGESACAPVDLANGWKLALEAPGEKGVSSPLVSSGRVFFTSYVPSTDSSPATCSSAEGTGRVYTVKLGNGAAGRVPAAALDPLAPRHRFSVIGAGMPGDVIPYRNRVLVPGRGMDGELLTGIPGRGRWRAYWREEDVDSP